MMIRCFRSFTKIHLTQLHWSIGEDGWVHESQGLSYLWSELHLVQDVLIEVDAGCNFYQLQLVISIELEDASFGYVLHPLCDCFVRLGTAKCDFPIYMAGKT